MPLVGLFRRNDAIEQGLILIRARAMRALSVRPLAPLRYDVDALIEKFPGARDCSRDPAHLDIRAKYEGYIARRTARLSARRNGKLAHSGNDHYASIKACATKRAKSSSPSLPEAWASAANQRITPADVMVLAIHLDRK